jgi:hypothetical protein
MDVTISCDDSSAYTFVTSSGEGSLANDGSDVEVSDDGDFGELASRGSRPSARSRAATSGGIAPTLVGTL